MLGFDKKHKKTPIKPKEKGESYEVNRYGS